MNSSSPSEDRGAHPEEQPGDNRELKDRAEARRHQGGTAVERALGGNPLGAALGAVAGAAVGAVGGTAAGPVGSVFGAAAGAVLGALAGGAAETAAGEPLAEDKAWREHQARLPEGSPRYDDLEPAYRIGDAAGSGDWDEARLAGFWADGGSPLPWAQARPAARHAWELARQRERQAAPSPTPTAAATVLPTDPAAAADTAQTPADYQPRKDAS